MIQEVNEAEAHLRSLLERARGPGLSAAAAASILSRADDLAKRFSAVPVAELHGRIRQTLLPVIGTIHREPNRCRLLAGELDRIKEPSARNVRSALEAAGLARETVSDLRTARELRRLLGSKLSALDQFYRRAATTDPDRLHSQLRDLEELHDALPPDDLQAKNLLKELKGWLQERRESVLDQRHLESLLDQLRQWIRVQDRADHEQARKALSRNRWAVSHPKDSRVVEARELLDRLRRIAKIRKSLEALPDRVRDDLGRVRILAAVEHIRQLHHQAVEHGVRDLAPLRDAAELILHHLEARWEQEAEAAELQTEPTAEALQGRIEELESALGWLRQLPEALHEGAPDLEERLRNLADAEKERLQTVLLAREKEIFRTLPVTELADYRDSLERSGVAVLEEWAVVVARLIADLEAARGVEEELDEACLRRLERARSEVPPGPVSDEAARLAQAYREATIAIAEVESAEEPDSQDDKRDPKRLDEYRELFPAWRRLQRAQGMLRDSGRLHEVRTAAATATAAGVAEARKLARELTESSVQAPIEVALVLLEQVVATRDRMGEYADAFTREQPPARLAESIHDAVGIAGGFVEALEGEAYQALEGEFPDAWTTLQDRIRLFLLDELPAAVRRWLLEALRAVRSQERLDALRRSFDGWLQALPGDLCAVKDEGERLFGRRRAELQVSALAREKRFEQALTVLADNQALFEAADHQQREGELRRRAAVAAFHDGRDGALAEIMEVCRDFGADEELLRIVVDHFRVTGATRQLVELAGANGESLAAFPRASQLARWALLFQHEELARLAEELAASDDPESVRAWIEGLSRVGAERQAHAFHTLWSAQQLDRSWDGGLVRSAEIAAAGLRRSLSGDHLRIENALRELEGRFQDSDEPDREAAESGGDDAELRRQLDRAFEDVRSLIGEGETALKAWRKSLYPAQAWLAATGEFPRLPQLMERIEQLAERLTNDAKTLDELDRARAEVLASASGTDGWDRLRPIVHRVGPGSLPALQRLRRLIIVYFQDYFGIVKIVDQLGAAHQAGGEGLTIQQLLICRDQLDQEFHYDFRPGFDRFNLRPRFPHENFGTFVEELEQMVREVEEVDRYAGLCRQAIHSLDLLERRLRNFEAESSTTAREARLAAIAELLDQVLENEATVREVFEARPEVSLSEPARSRLAKLGASQEYRLLERAVELLRTEHG